MGNCKESFVDGADGPACLHDGQFKFFRNAAFNAALSFFNGGFKGMVSNKEAKMLFGGVLDGHYPWQSGVPFCAYR